MNKRGILELVDISGIQNKSTNDKSAIQKKSKKDVAIVGISFRLPKSNNLEELWECLRNGIDCITDFPENRRKDIEAYLKSSHRSVNKEKFGKSSYLDEVAGFDAEIFRISPSEAEQMDPNQRLLLETAWNALEDAGYGGEALAGSKTGVYVGFRNDEIYSYKHILSSNVDKVNSNAIPGNLSSIIPSRISYVLNLRGPAMYVDTACSSSLVALHLACQGMSSGDCDSAIVAGIRINLIPVKDDANMLDIESNHGRTCAFDNDFHGTIWGEGVVAIYIKPLYLALEHGDHIYAVVKGSAINQDGASAGIAAPNALSQENVIVDAWKKAGIEPPNVSYIETHGTGTFLGDPIEINGIRRAFQHYTNEKQFCGIGSIKTNLGHTDGVSGLVSLLKVILSMKYHTLLPTIHFGTPNDQIDFESSPVYINTRLRKWEPKNGKMIAGISAFGMSGTNCHIILEEPPKDEVQECEEKGTAYLLCVSAKGEQGIIKLINSYKDCLIQNDNLSVKDCCYNTQVGRGHYRNRLCIVCGSKKELVEKLDHLCVKGLEETEDVFYGSVRIVNDNVTAAKGEIRQSQQRILTNTANHMIRELIASKERAKDKMRSIAKLYCKGAKVDWKLLYHKDLKVFHKSLPAYPFEHKRYWIDYGEGQALSDQRVQSSNAMKRMIHSYNRDWIAVNQIEMPISESEQGYVLLGGLHMGNTEQVFMEKYQVKVIRVMVGNEFCRHNPYLYDISASLQDIQLLLNYLEAKKHLKFIVMLDEILHDENGKTDCYIELILNLGKTLMEYQLMHKIELFFIVKNSNLVIGDEMVLSTEGILAESVARILSGKRGELLCKVIDIDNETNFEDIMKEVNYKTDVLLVCYRHGLRYEECIREAEINECQDTITGNGIYIIAMRKLSRFEYAFAQSILKKDKAFVIFITEDEKEEKAKWLRECSGANKNRVEFLSYQTLKYEFLSKIPKGGKEKMHHVKGVYYRICDAGSGSISDVSVNQVNACMRDELVFAENLSNIFDQNSLDFFLTVSNDDCILVKSGEILQSYTSNYLNWIIRDRVRKNKKGCSLHLSETLSMFAGKRLEISEIEEEVEFLLNHIVKQNGKTLILHSRFDNDLRFYQGNLIGENLKKWKEFIKIIGKEKEELDKYDIMVATAFSDSTGMSEINFHDTFYELGVDSIVAARLFGRLYELVKAEKKEIDLTEYFQYTTAYDIANRLREELENNNQWDTACESELLEKEQGFSVRRKIGLLHSNCYAITAGDESIIIDPSVVMDKIIELGEEKELNVKYLCVTHAHVDHVYAFPLLRKKTDAAVVIHGSEINLLNNDKENFTNILGNTFQIKCEIRENDLIVKGEEKFNLNNISVDIIYLGEHTEGSIGFLVKNSLFTGDAILTQEDAYRLLVEKEYGKQVRKCMQRQGIRETALTIYPGHGEKFEISLTEIEKK